MKIIIIILLVAIILTDFVIIQSYKDLVKEYQAEINTSLKANQFIDKKLDICRRRLMIRSIINE